MKSHLITATVLLLCAGCVEDTVSGTGANSSGGTASGTLRERSDGSYALGVTVGDGAFCSAIYSSPEPNGSEIRPLSCTGGQSGNATVLYDAAGNPKSASYGGLEIGSGTVRF
ncbi:hypothetical protein [Salipiger bermudensis]|uniref:Uncharacterized protein n=1 Tax=Salipiger bermudensis (strain DSM 26914 / JCM 13377 / KCTC 12554 / HTCC2601) TaxID=314265 RepID=Q0FT67_SALBH|nr:hypothetical protein [Salipiger bermudensis]EAU47302.1 hypothetical protein R2601_20861 [Salipiger bermudensis HTCC2601]